MALKSFKAETLNGNWFEERAQPLRGVIADYGIRSSDVEPRSRSDFMHPAKVDSYSKNQGTIHRLLTPEYLEMIADQKDSSIPDDNWVDRLPRHRPDFNKRYLETNTQASYGTAPRVSKRMQKLQKAKSAGVTARREPQQRRTGACGELLRTNADPQNNTAAQRSWLYSQDPALAANEKKAVPRPMPEYMSLQLGGRGTKKRVTNARQTSNITRGNGVAGKSSGMWAD